ncbi:MAG: glycoside hydrolase family 2 protein, partial [bacterium]
PNSFDDFIYKCQIVQGEALKHCIEHWRQNKFRTAGSLIWQLNDCWPVCSWSLIDSELKPKAAYFYVRRAFIPILVTFFQKDDRIEIWVVNDTRTTLNVFLKLSGLSFTGEKIFSKNLDLMSRENSVLKACHLNRQQFEMNSSARQFIKAELYVQSKFISENRFFFKRLKHLKMPPLTFQMQLERTNAKNYVLNLCSPHFAKAVRIETDFKTRIEDNFFDMDANCVRSVKLCLLESKKLTLDNLTIQSLCNTTENLEST